MTDKPWFRFYPVDWRGDAKLKVCSLAARGLWIDLISLMHEGVPYGHLILAGRAPSEADLAKLLGVPAGQVRRALAELEHRGVALRTEAGVVFSKRMVRDAEKAETDKANGQRGGNPQVKPWVNPPVKAAGGPARARPGSGSGNSSGVEGFSGEEPEKGVGLVLVQSPALDLSPGQLQAAVPGLVGAWNNIAAAAPPLVAVEGFRSHPKATAALRTHPSIDWWSGVFQRVATSDFLRGVQPMSDGRTFVADFWWCLDNADKIAAGRYDNRERVAPVAPATKAQAISTRNAAAADIVRASLRAEGAIS